MKQTGKRAQKWRWLLLVALVVLGLQLLQGLFTLRNAPVRLLREENDWLDLQGEDAAAGLFQLEGSWDFYPEKLYTSQDFAAGRAGEAVGEGVSPSDDAYGTHRLRIRATPGAYYAICGFSVDYATRVFVNGSQVVVFGNPAETAEQFVPRVGYMTLPACAGAGWRPPTPRLLRPATAACWYGWALRALPPAVWRPWSACAKKADPAGAQALAR